MMGPNEMAFTHAYVPPVAPVVELPAPRRFKTAFIFFSSARHKEIKVELAKEGRTEKVRTLAAALAKRAMEPCLRTYSPCDFFAWVHSQNSDYQHCQGTVN
jgi:hypothetical protein